MKRLLLLCIYLFSFHNIGKQNHIHPIHILTHTFRLTKIKLEFWNQNMKKKYVVRLSENYSLLKAYCVMIFYYYSFYRDWPSLWKAPLCNDLYSSFFYWFFFTMTATPFHFSQRKTSACPVTCQNQSSLPSANDKAFENKRKKTNVQMESNMKQK